MIVQDHETGEETHFSENYSSSRGNIQFPELEPRLFSFNSPHGACQECHGIGYKQVIDPSLVVPNSKLSLEEGAIQPWASSGSGSGWYFSLLRAVSEKYDIPMDKPFKALTFEQQKIILNGTEDIEYEVNYVTSKGTKQNYVTTYEGVIPNLERRYKETESEYSRRKIEGYMEEMTCPVCKGNRLRPEVMSVLLDGQSIMHVTELSVEKAVEFFKGLKLSEMDKEIAKMILMEIQSRLDFLMNVGLGYLSLNRSANTLSGGEAQRIRLATQIGSKLSGVLYVLDEPSIGLHQKDNDRLITTLLGLRDLGNTVIVVEHDTDTMLAADHILDIGPGAGKHGGNVLSEGTPEEIMKDEKSVTGGFLSGRLKFEVPEDRREGNGKKIEIIEASENNLKNVSIEVPLGKFIAVTGVSGSGKSTLVNEILLKAAAKSVNKRSKARPGEHKKITGLENVDKVINIDQSPIGRTPRSNPATYTGVFTEIRKMMAQTNEAKLRGYKIGRFSFNVKGGRCEACSGDGVKKIEMHFLPDVHVTCEVCNGKRYNAETLEVTYRGKNIADILEMTVEEAYEFFTAIPTIKTKLETLKAVGLDYIHLGQQANTLSGGEAQRVKLATELSKRSTGKTLYVLDEPTTGLHFQDVSKLLEVLHTLADMGNTVLVIEHNLDVVKTVDHVIDLGPDGGDHGGEIVATGTPEEVASVKGSYTGQWLKKII
jgi:excinuclease ABC subunit A